MALPPVLVALSVAPIEALWVVIFYLALNEFMRDVVMPHVRASTMYIHLVSSLIMTLALASAFGILGTLIATPVAGLIQAYYMDFYLAKQKPDPQINNYLNFMRGKDIDNWRENLFA